MPGPEKPSDTPQQEQAPLQLGERPKESPENKLDKKVYGVLGKFEEKFKKAKDENQAEKVVEEARKTLEDTLNKSVDLTSKLPIGFEKKYERVFMENWKMEYGRDWHIVVTKEGDKINVKKYFHPWDKDTGYSP